MHICLSALADSSSGRCGNFLCYCWMMLRVDGCLNEDPGPLPGPREIKAELQSYLFYDRLAIIYELHDMHNIL